MISREQAEFRVSRFNTAARPRFWPVRDEETVARPSAGDTLPDWTICIGAIARHRDKKQFALLFDHFAPRLKSYFIRLAVDNGTAEELVQEAMLSVWRKADYFDPARASVSTWIFTIARNLRIDIARRERDPHRLAEAFEPIPEPMPDECVTTFEREARIRTAIGILPSEQANIIRLHFFEDRSHAEIAGMLDLPLGTVKSRVRLAMGKIRALVEDLQ
ncbi:MAG TPA: sigma-70 family RNA polymerase sigma factor [Rhizomicrobium sp.]|jgi:RNA polymerase sigma-70 factor (ECF subfamily)